MKPLKYFLIFGICVVTVVVLAQSALGATRAAVAKPVSRVVSFEPMRHSAKVVAPVRYRAAIASPAKFRATKTSAARFRANVAVAKVRPGMG